MSYKTARISSGNLTNAQKGQSTSALIEFRPNTHMRLAIRIKQYAIELIVCIDVLNTESVMETGDGVEA